jgi:hypothetical protein
MSHTPVHMAQLFATLAALVFVHAAIGIGMTESVLMCCKVSATMRLVRSCHDAIKCPMGITQLTEIVLTHILVRAINL